MEADKSNGVDKNSIFTRCVLKVVGDGDKRHIEALCNDTDDAKELADLLLEEAVIRHKPRARPEAMTVDNDHRHSPLEEMIRAMAAIRNDFKTAIEPLFEEYLKERGFDLIESHLKKKRAQKAFSHNPGAFLPHPRKEEAIQALRDGVAPEDVALRLGISRRSVERWRSVLRREQPGELGKRRGT